MLKDKQRDTSLFWVVLLVVVGAETDSWPVIGVGHEGVIVGVPHSGLDKGILVQRLRIAERHALGIDKLHHLKLKRQSYCLGLRQMCDSL